MAKNQITIGPKRAPAQATPKRSPVIRPVNRPPGLPAYRAEGSREQG